MRKGKKRENLSPKMRAAIVPITLAMTFSMGSGLAIAEETNSAPVERPPKESVETNQVQGSSDVSTSPTAEQPTLSVQEQSVTGPSDAFEKEPEAKSSNVATVDTQESSDNGITIPTTGGDYSGSEVVSNNNGEGQPADGQSSAEKGASSTADGSKDEVDSSSQNDGQVLSGGGAAEQSDTQETVKDQPFISPIETHAASSAKNSIAVQNGNEADGWHEEDGARYYVKDGERVRNLVLAIGGTTAWRSTSARTTQRRACGPTRTTARGRAAPCTRARGTTTSTTTATATARAGRPPRAWPPWTAPTTSSHTTAAC